MRRFEETETGWEVVLFVFRRKFERGGRQLMYEDNSIRIDVKAKSREPRSPSLVNKRRERGNPLPKKRMSAKIHKSKNKSKKRRRKDNEERNGINVDGTYPHRSITKTQKRIAHRGAYLSTGGY